MKNASNWLTISRIGAVPALYLSLYLPDIARDFFLFVIFVLAALTDFFDGYVARRMGTASGFGRMLDPIADKLLTTMALVLLIYLDRISGAHLIAALIILCREVLVSGLREYLGGLRISMPVSRLAKIKTGLQFTAIPILLLGTQANYILDKFLWFLSFLNVTGDVADIGLGCLWGAALLTLITGYDYLRLGLKHADWDKQ